MEKINGGQMLTYPQLLLFDALPYHRLADTSGTIAPLTGALLLNSGDERMSCDPPTSGKATSVQGSY